MSKEENLEAVAKLLKLSGPTVVYKGKWRHGSEKVRKIRGSFKENIAIGQMVQKPDSEDSATNEEERQPMHFILSRNWMKTTGQLP